MLLQNGKSLNLYFVFPKLQAKQRKEIVKKTKMGDKNAI